MHRSTLIIHAIILLFISTSFSKCHAQPQQLVGGPCEGCEAIYENKESTDSMSWQLNMPVTGEEGQPLTIDGTVYKADGKTPAPGIVMYFYQTNAGGRYPTRGDEQGWGKRHGYIRGWLKTNDDGRYQIRTIRPGSYPNSTEPAHIHCIVKEEGLNEYYLADFLFADDPLITPGFRSQRLSKNPGGDGILKVETRNGNLYAQRDIFLGKDVMNYPGSESTTRDKSTILNNQHYPDGYCLAPNNRLPIRTILLPCLSAIL